MTHDEIIAKVKNKDLYWVHHIKAVLAVVELHRPYYNEGLTVGHCKGCQTTLDNVTRHVSYPCPTIAAIEKELG